MKNILKRTFILLLVLFLGFAGYYFVAGRQSSPDIAPVVPSSGEIEPVKDFSKEKAEYEANLAINPDYVGKITFESGIIDLPFVYGEDNDKYLRRNWETMEYDEFGSIFMDCDNTINDQNVVLYGHMAYEYKDPTGTRMFTPLKKFVSEDFYKDNSKIDLYLENEVRHFEIGAVYYCPLVQYADYWTTPDDMAYYSPYFTDEYFRVYKESFGKKMFYETGVELNSDDRFLTLQTCVENHPELRLIVIAKEISVERYGR